MIYFNDGAILIRDLADSDAQIITDAEVAQGWHQTIDKYLKRLEDQSNGKCLALVAEYKGNVAGYVNLYTRSSDGPFVNTDWPEIIDFGVLEKYRRNGIGTALMNTVEALATRTSDTVCIGVGLHSGYGSAQRMYVRRGYIPDGSGVWYDGQVCPDYGPCVNGDELVLHFFKKLR